MHFNEFCVATGLFGESPLCLLSVFLVFRSLHSTIFPTHTRWLKLKQNSAQKHHCHHHCHAWLMRWQSRWMPLNPLRPLRVVSSLSQGLSCCLLLQTKACGCRGFIPCVSVRQSGVLVFVGVQVNDVGSAKTCQPVGRAVFMLDVKRHTECVGGNVYVDGRREWTCRRCHKDCMSQGLQHKWKRWD